MQPTIGQLVDDALAGIERDNPSLKAVLPKDFARPDLDGTLDDKIELNRRMNETLEAMARALFKSWFVDFDPGAPRIGAGKACAGTGTACPGTGTQGAPRRHHGFSASYKAGP